MHTMAKLTVLAAALLIALFALTEAEATTITTTVTTITIDDESKGCQEQLQAPQDQEFQDACWVYITHQESMQPTPVVKQRITCCWTLEHRFTPECRCKAIEDMVRRQTKKGEWQGQKMQQVMQKAQNLPRECNIQQPQQCQIQVPSWF